MGSPFIVLRSRGISQICHTYSEDMYPLRCGISYTYTLLVTLLHYAGSIEEPHRVHESGEIKSVGFKATVSNFV